METQSTPHIDIKDLSNITTKTIKPQRGTTDNSFNGAFNGACCLLLIAPTMVALNDIQQIADPTTKDLQYRTQFPVGRSSLYLSEVPGVDIIVDKLIAKV